MAKNEDIDWEGLLTFGSLVGNLVQAHSSQKTKEELKIKEQALANVLNDREALLNNLRNFQNAVGVFEEKTKKLEEINNTLLNEKEEQAKTIVLLYERINRLEEERNKLTEEYSNKLEIYLNDKTNDKTNDK